MGLIFQLFSYGVAVAVIVRLLNPKEDLGEIWKQNRYTQGNFAPVDNELSNVPVEIMYGSIPQHLNQSSYMRTGPNPVVREGHYHWFDGDGMIHKIDLGSMTFSSAYVKTRRLVEGDDALGVVRIGEMAVHPFKSIAKIIYNAITKGAPESTHQSGRAALGNTALLFHNKKLFALMEGDLPYEIDPVTLDTIGLVDLPTGMTAHPKILYSDQELRYFHWDIVTKSTYYSVRAHDGELIHQSSFPFEYRAILNHDFGVTREYSVFLDMPLEAHIFSSAFFGTPFCALDTTKKTRVVVSPRLYTPESAMEFWIDSVAIVHTVNTFVDGNEVVFRTCGQNKLDLIGNDGSVDFKNDAGDHMATLREYRFNVRNGDHSMVEIEGGINGEFPMINKRYMGMKNRYTYLARFSDSFDDEKIDGFMKVDHDTTGGIKRRLYVDGGRGGEPMFIPGSADEDIAEDDGYICSFVYYIETNTSEWHLYRADGDMELVARVLLPQRVPYGFHGLYLPAE